jgi:hypothetical protein
MLPPTLDPDPELLSTFSNATTNIGKSTMDGNRGRNDPGDISPGNIFRKDFSNFSQFQAMSLSNNGKN